MKYLRRFEISQNYPPDIRSFFPIVDFCQENIGFPSGFDKEKLLNEFRWGQYIYSNCAEEFYQSSGDNEPRVTVSRETFGEKSWTDEWEVSQLTFGNFDGLSLQIECKESLLLDSKGSYGCNICLECEESWLFEEICNLIFRVLSDYPDAYLNQTDFCR